jgi:hypothetical protein
MGISIWYAADLTFDGKVLSRISTGEVDEDYTSPLYRGCDKATIEEFVRSRVARELSVYECS